LDTDFLSKVEEVPTFELDTQDKLDDWTRFKKQSYYFYTLLAKQGNKLYFNHKVDKRGRIYSQGYHLNTQGTAFKKAMLEFAKEELVTGLT
jgi:DNA-directed RNA polymerase